MDQQVVKISLNVSGMSCASCVGRVERALKKVPYVIDAQVNLATEQATIQGQADLTAEQLIQAIRKAGYDAEVVQDAALSLQFAIEGMSCASCVGRVERAIQKIPQVQSVQVNLATEQAHVVLNSPIDTQSIIDVITKAGYQATFIVPQTATSTSLSLSEKRAQEAQFFYHHLWLAILLALPVFILAMGGHVVPQFHHWINQHIGQHNSWLIQWFLTTLVLFFPGRRFYQLGIPALLRAAPDMNSLVAVGTLAAYVYSLIATFVPQCLPPQNIAVYYESAAVIIALILFGRYLEAKAKGRSSQAIQHLLGLQAKTAHVLQNQQVVDIPLQQLKPNDIILIKAGEKIPADGTVIDGQSHVDESMMNGEPLPIHKTIHDSVIGGTINQQGVLTVRVQAVGEQTVLAQIIRTVEQAQGSKLPIQTLVDKITLWFVPAVMSLALLTFILWLMFAPTPALTLALVNAVAVLIIACPCAMGLATPTSIMVGTGRAAELGVLFRNGEALQQLKDSKIIAFDKTGTLTQGKPQLTDFIARHEQDSTSLLALAAALEAQSEHPIAQAVVQAAQQQQLALPAVTQVSTIAGFGIQAIYQQQQVYLGAERFMQQRHIDTSALATYAEQFAQQGKTPCYIAIEQQVVAVFAVADSLKTESAEVIRALHQQGLHVAMISGDQPVTAHYIAEQLGIDHVEANVLPEQKAHIITQLRQKYGTVAYVGDGINDAPALATADVGIAIGTGTDVAIETADIVLMSGNVQGVLHALRLSQATITNIKQNLFWAFAYNVACIPVAAGILYPFFGILLSPMFAAAAMALSSTFVLSNALRLKYIQV